MAITVSGTSIVFNDSTTQTTAFTGGGGTVTSVATGNGLSGGTITSSGTLVIAAPSSNTVGSYCTVISGSTAWQGAGTTYTYGSNYSVGNGQNALRILCSQGNGTTASTSLISGTWKWMSCTASINGCDTIAVGMACRVS